MCDDKRLLTEILNPYGSRYLLSVDPLSYFNLHCPFVISLYNFVIGSDSTPVAKVDYTVSYKRIRRVHVNEVWSSYKRKLVFPLIVVYWSFQVFVTLSVSLTIQDLR